MSEREAFVAGYTAAFRSMEATLNAGLSSKMTPVSHIKIRLEALRHPECPDLDIDELAAELGIDLSPGEFDELFGDIPRDGEG